MEKFNPTKEMIEAAKSVFMAMAWVDTIRPVVESYEKAILARHQFHIAKEWIDKGMTDRVILESKSTYLMEDADFKIFNAETFEERDKAGLKVDKPEFCPLLTAECLQVDAEYKLIEAMKPVTRLETSSLWGENRKKFLDLTLKLLAPFVGNAKEILAA